MKKILGVIVINLQTQPKPKKKVVLLEKVDVTESNGEIKEDKWQIKE